MYESLRIVQLSVINIDIRCPTCVDHIQAELTRILVCVFVFVYFFFFQAEDGIRDLTVTGVQTCALPISRGELRLRQLDLPLGLGEPPLGRLDGGARRLVDRLGLVEVAARDQLALQELPEALELPPRLALRAPGADDVGAHRAGRRAPRLEPRARLLDGRLARAHRDGRPLEARARLVDRRARLFPRQPQLRPRLADNRLRHR